MWYWLREHLWQKTDLDILWLELGPWRRGRSNMGFGPLKIVGRWIADKRGG